MERLTEYNKKQLTADLIFSLINLQIEYAHTNYLGSCIAICILSNILLDIEKNPEKIFKDGTTDEIQ